MIELQEILEAREPKTGEELQDTLLRQIGRIVRIRHARLEPCTIESARTQGPFDTTCVAIDEYSGRLLIVGLKSLFVPVGQIEGLDNRLFHTKEFTLGLEGAGEPREINFDLELQIQALLPDGGGWRIIHESAGWEALMRQGESS